MLKLQGAHPPHPLAPPPCHQAALPVYVGVHNRESEPLFRRADKMKPIYEM